MADTASQFEVHLVPCLSDNYAYLLVDPQTKQAAAVDPVEPAKVLAKAAELGVTLSSVLTTHHHWDHAGGNPALLQLLSEPVPVYGGDERVDALSHRVADGDTILVGGLSVHVHATPCHTRGHVLYHVEPSSSSPALFTGDTLFVGGCGRFFEGTGAEMHHALTGVISRLSPSTRVFCGHEYTVANLRFAQAMEPTNEAIAQKLAWATAQREQGLPTIPSTVSEELQHNPFMRLDSAELIHTLSQSSAVSAASSAADKMALLREAKNAFK